jgi:hypothetical protein
MRTTVHRARHDVTTLAASITAASASTAATHLLLRQLLDGLGVGVLVDADLAALGLGGTLLELPRHLDGELAERPRRYVALLVAQLVRVLFLPGDDDAAMHARSSHDSEQEKADGNVRTQMS